MKESVDRKLKEHIIKVFDDYDDNGAEQGWQDLRKKYPGKPVRRIILWWSSAAAVLTLTGTLLFLNTFTNNENVLTTIKNTPKTIVRDTAVKADGLTFNKPEVSNEMILSSKGKHALSEEKPVLSAQKPVEIAPAELSHSTYVKEINVIDFNASVVSKKEPAEILSLKVDSQYIAPQETETVISRIPEEQYQLHTDKPINQNNAIDRTLTIGSNSFNGNQRSISPEKKPDRVEKKKELRDNKFELSFYAGPFFNYAQGSNNSMNLGAGVSSGISLTKRFTLIAGLALANNTLVFDNELPAKSYATYLNNSAMDQKPPSSLVASTVPQISKLEAQLLNLDIPINIKYSISREPDKVFITAGLSSFTYLNESYNYSYNNLNGGQNSFSSSQPRNEVINRNFGKFDLAQTLNVSFGLTHRAKVQSFVLEPFIKYPLGALGSQNIRFGSAGINFKLSINPASKNSE